MECSAKAAGCAVCEDGHILAESYVNVPLTHSQTLLQMTENMLKNADIPLQSIDRFALSAGPGSFTGLRIGAAAVKGMALGAGKPCVSVPTLQALAWGAAAASPADVVCAAMDARCGQVYAALFEWGDGEPRPLCEDMALPVAELIAVLKKYGGRRIVFVGDGAEICYNELTNTQNANFALAPEPFRWQRAAFVALLSERLPDISAAGLCPVYLRQPQAVRQLESKKP